MRQTNDLSPRQTAEPTSPMTLRLFGSPVLLAGRDMVPLGRRARAILAYLTLSDPPRATRERLAGLFWPDRAEAQARASLRQCIVELRAALGEAVQTDREWVVLAADDLASDWVDIDAGIASSNPGRLAAAITAIGAAPLLDGMSFGDSFDDWLRSTRALIDSNLAAAVTKQMTVAGDGQGSAGALTLADAWLAREPLDEAIVTAAVSLEIAQDAPLAARKRYRNFEEALARDGVGSPGPALRAAIGAAEASPPQDTQEPSPEARSHEKPSIAVMLFRHPPNDEDQAYFAEGMADDIIAGLARSHMMRVTSRHSSLSYAAKAAKSSQIAAELDVRYIVNGQIRRMGETMRVTVDLTDGTHDQTIWSGRYDRPLTDLFSVQDEITNAIVATIEPALLAREQSRAVEGNHGLHHWNLLMRGRYHFWRATSEDQAKAKAFLTEALSLAPDDAATLSLLAMVELGEIWAGKNRDVPGLLRRAFDYSMRAVAIDPRDAAAHYAMGIVLAFMGHSEQAAAEQRLALELNPISAPARGELGRLLAFRGKTEEALAFTNEAIRLSPTDPHVWLWYRSKAIAHFCDGQTKAAVVSALDACARRPDYFFLHFLVAACHAADGNIEAARSACNRALEIHPRYSRSALIIGHPFARPADLENFIAALSAAGWQG